MKAGIYDPYLDSLGGGEKYTLTFAKTLEKLGWQVDIWWWQDLKEVIKRRFDLELNVRFVKFDPVKAFIWDKLSRTAEYDLVFWVGDGSVPLSRAKQTILHMQVPTHWAGSGTWWNKLKAQRLTVVCNSKFTKSVIDKVYSVDAKIVYPPVDVEKFVSVTKTNTIIGVGRFSRILHAKRQDILIRGFTMLNARYPAHNYRLILAGGGSDKEYLNYLQKQATGLPIEFVIDPSMSKMRELVGKSKIFWSATGFEVNVHHDPEKVEHFGIAVVEAMAAGSVPVVTGVGGHLETVQDGVTGFLWKSIDDLVGHTKKLIDNPKILKEMSYQAHLKSQKFSTRRFEETVATILQASVPSGK